MLIKLIITFVTIFLLFNEYFKIIEKANKRNKRKILLIALSIMSILSVIDVVQEVKENNALVEKANKIIILSDTLISRTNLISNNLKKTIKSVEKSSQSLTQIDSVLKNVRDTLSRQVNILKESVNKSKKIVALEQLKFDQDEAKIDVTSDRISGTINQKDSTIIKINFSFKNEGIRTATQIIVSVKIIFHIKGTNIFKLIKSINKYDFIEDLNYLNDGGSTTTISSANLNPFPKSASIIIILKCEYKDAISKKKLSYTGHFNSVSLETKKIEFHIGFSSKLREGLNSFLIKEDLTDFIID